MAYALIDSAIAASSDALSATTAAIDTTGANFLVIGAAWYPPNTNAAVSDSKSNTWLPLTAEISSDSAVQFFYAESPTVGSGHTFTIEGITPDNLFPTIQVQAWSGAASSSVFYQEAGHQNNLATIQAGTVTPTTNDQLIVALVSSLGGIALETIDLGFTIETVHPGSGPAISGAMAYLVQTTATAVDPQWTGLAGGNTAVIATFKAAGGGGGTTWPGYIAPFGWQ